MTSPHQRISRGTSVLVQKRQTLLSMLLRAFAVLLTAFIAVTSVGTAPAYAAAKEPVITATSALIYCEDTDEIVYEKNGSSRVDPYSTTKLLTALVVLEKEKDLDREVTVSEYAASRDGSTMDLAAGEVVTIRQLLYGLLILSGNDAAYALAENEGGIKTFVGEMNEKAKELGCTNTHFDNPNGNKEENHYTTPEDYLKVAQAALDNEMIYSIASTKKYTMPATNKSEERVMKSHLDLHNKKDSGVLAGKTGRWDEQGSVVLMYDKKDLSLMILTFGGDIEERTEDVQALFDYAHEIIPSKKVASKGEKVGKVFVHHGAITRVPVYATDDLYTYAKLGEEPASAPEVDLNKVEAPLKKGENVANLVAYSATGERQESVPVEVKQSVKEGWLPSYLYIPNAAVIPFVLLVLILLYLRNQRKKNRRKRRKRVMGD